MQIVVEMIFPSAQGVISIQHTNPFLNIYYEGENLLIYLPFNFSVIMIRPVNISAAYLFGI